MTTKIFDGKEIIHILPQPKEMFEFSAILSYFRRTTAAAEGEISRPTSYFYKLERDGNEYFTGNRRMALNNKGISICRISILRHRRCDGETEPIKRYNEFYAMSLFIYLK